MEGITIIPQLCILKTSHISGLGKPAFETNIFLNGR